MNGASSSGRIAVCTWNVGEKRPTLAEVSDWLGAIEKKDLYFVFLIEKRSGGDEWLSKLVTSSLRDEYKICCALSSRLGSLVIAYRQKTCQVSELSRSEAAVCLDIYGGISVRITFKGRTLRCLALKMPPGEGRAAQRSAVVRESFRRLILDNEIDDHIILAGDLQYRLQNESPCRAEARYSLWQSVKQKNWQKLAALDELDMERRAGHCLAGFDSLPLEKCVPTFFGKAPAYTDRVLWRSRAGLRTELSALDPSSPDQVLATPGQQRRHRGLRQVLQYSGTDDEFNKSVYTSCLAQLTARYLAVKPHHQVQLRGVLNAANSTATPSEPVHIGAGGGKIEWKSTETMSATSSKRTLVLSLRIHDDEDPDDDFAATAELDALSLSEMSWRTFLAPLLGDGGEICGVLSGRAILQSANSKELPPLPKETENSLGGLVAAGSKVWRFNKKETNAPPHTAAVRAELLYEQLRASSRQLQSLESKLKAEHEARIAAENRAAMLSSVSYEQQSSSVKELGLQPHIVKNGSTANVKAEQSVQATMRSSANFLRSIPLFQGLSELHLAKLQEALTVRQFDAGEVIIKQGDPDGEEFYVIERGRVRVLVGAPSIPPPQKDEAHHKFHRSNSILDATSSSLDRTATEPREVALLNPGDYFGERALVLNEPRASNCIADLGGVTCLVLDREAFEDAISDVGHLLGEVFSGYEHDARDLSKSTLERYVTAYADLLRAVEDEEDDNDSVNFFSVKQAAGLELALLTALTPDLGVDEILEQGVKVLKDIGIVTDACQVFFPVDIERQSIVEFTRYSHHNQMINFDDTRHGAVIRAAESGRVTNQNDVIAVPVSLADAALLDNKDDDALKLADLNTTDEDENEVVAVLAVRGCPPASADRLAAALSSAAREIGVALRDRRPEVELAARPQRERYISSAHVAAPPAIHLRAITVAPETDASDDVIARKIEEHRHQLKLKREEQQDHHHKDKKKKKKNGETKASSASPVDDDDDQDSADSSSAAYGLYDSLIKHEAEKLFVRVALKHGDKLLAKPWDSPLAPLQRSDESLFPTMIVDFEGAVVDFEPLDNGKPKMQVLDLPQATTLEFSLRTKTKPLAYCKLGYWSESNVALNGELRFSLAAGDPARSARRRLVRGPAYPHDDSAPCVLELSAPLFELSRTPVYTQDFTLHDARASVSGGGMTSIALDSKSIDTILATHAVHEMDEEDTATVWQARTTLSQTHSPAALTKLALAVDWSVRDMVLEMYMLLEEWPLMAPLDALQLLSLRIVDPKVRGYAVRCLDVLTDADLADIMLQLVQVVKFERSHDTTLSRFLLRRALKNPYVCGHALYWSLATEKDVKDYDHHSCRVLVDLYVRYCGEYRVKLGHQVLIVSKLTDVSKKIKAKHELEEKELDALLRSELKSIVLPRNFQLPLSPFMVCRGLDVDKCKVLSSAQKPLWLHFLDANGTKGNRKDANTNAPATSDHVVIFKCGDDLRQDQLTLQLIRTMDKYWRAAGLDLRMSPYGCVATAAKQGFIEVVQNAKTLAGISKEERFRAYGKPHFRISRKYSAAAEAYYGTDFLLRWIKHEAPIFQEERKVSEGDTYADELNVIDLKNSQNDVSIRQSSSSFSSSFSFSKKENPLTQGPAVVEALDNFARSLAGYCVATYVLGIGDRHNDNIMLTRNALFFHIDFGHFLGNFKQKFGIKREKAPFVFTPSFEKVLGGRSQGENYHLFENLATEAFLTARRHRDEILVLLMLMVDCGIPELMTLADVDWVLHTLMADVSDDALAAKHFRGLITEALNCKRTRSLHAIHSLVVRAFLHIFFLFIILPFAAYTLEDFSSALSFSAR